jgi:hypothetical protein
VLQWLRANGEPWDMDVTTRAANEGHVTLLRWAIENGCVYDERSFAVAASGGGWHWRPIGRSQAIKGAKAEPKRSEA